MEEEVKKEEEVDIKDAVFVYCFKVLFLKRENQSCIREGGK